MSKERELKKLGSHLRQLRTDKGLSIKELAEKCDKAYQVLQRIEAGKENPSMFLLSQIANSGFGIKLEKLLQGLK